jgi:uncharacterized phage protein (TIGR01671 family)
MREIKFRVWNKATKSWLNDDAGTHCWSEYCLNIFTGEVVEFVTSDNKFFSRANEPNFYFDKNTHVKESPYVVQQYTGLKDKNGVEIYEGDIISGEFYDTEYHHSETIKSEVVFKYGAFNIAIREWHKPSLKVIGDVFENPELLKR